ncbi:hypothetical protein Taro_006331 [Colocasia esculenta]|uniref:Uncharacterized protein n=1 Tax=Colocasia esculenta TaxID=4460 RepID=A0A843TQU6_COLES|nr:hypothetical protein [Colocasia esculenta]
MWRCRIGRGNAVAWCNSCGSSRRVRCEPGDCGRFERVLSMCGALAPVALLECIVHVLDMWFTWKTCVKVHTDLALPSVVVWRLFRNASLVGYPRFFVSQTRMFVVLGVLSRYWCCTVEVCVVFLDTLTPEFELYVRLRERRQWGSDFPEFVLVSLLDLSSVIARLRGRSCVVLSGLDTGLIS